MTCVGCGQIFPWCTTQLFNNSILNATIEHFSTIVFQLSRRIQHNHCKVAYNFPTIHKLFWTIGSNKEHIPLHTQLFLFPLFFNSTCTKKTKKLLQQWSIFFKTGILLESYSHIYNGFKT
jgi:hypothetical protein